MERSLRSLIWLLVAESLVPLVPATPNALNLLEGEVQTLKRLVELYKETISYKHNLHEILKPFLTERFRAAVKGHAKERVSALLLQPVGLLDDPHALDTWLSTTRASKPFRAGTGKVVTKEVIELMKMALESKFTSEMEATVKKAVGELTSSLM